MRSLLTSREVWRVLEMDTTPPEVSWKRPPAGELSRAVPTVLVEVSDNIGVSSVVLLEDGTLVSTLELMDEVGPDTYGTLWDSRATGQTRYTLTVEAEDMAGNVGSASIEVSVPIG
jgi:chitinase